MRSGPNPRTLFFIFHGFDVMLFLSLFLSICYGIVKKKKKNRLWVCCSVRSEVATNCLLAEADLLFLETIIVQVPELAFSLPWRHHKSHFISLCQHYWCQCTKLAGPVKIAAQWFGVEWPHTRMLSHFNTPPVSLCLPLSYLKKKCNNMLGLAVPWT